MKRSVLAVSCMAAATLVAGQVDAQFYYGSFGRIPLLIDSTTITIKFDEGIDAAARLAVNRFSLLPFSLDTAWMEW